jgi:hypothetical protein
MRCNSNSVFKSASSLDRVLQKRHPGELVAKVGYFGVKSLNRLKCTRVQIWAPNLLKSVAWPPVCAKVRRGPAPRTNGRLRKKVFDPRREQSC